MHYVVTGGAGFIGSHIVDELVKRGHSVKVIDNLSEGKIDNLSDILDRIDFVKGDIRNLGLLIAELEGADYVLHQAALKSVLKSMEHPVEYNDVNVSGTYNVLTAAKKNNVKRAIFASSSSVYGDSPELPKREESTGKRLSPYSITKFAGEDYCRYFAGVHGLETVILRYFNVFGPRQDPNSFYSAVIPKFIKSMLYEEPPVIYGDGEQTRDCTYVSNIVEANILACQAKDVVGEALNIANSEAVSVNQLFSKLNSLLGRNLKAEHTPPKQGEVRHSLADNSKAKRLLGYTGKIRLEEGLRLTIDWFTANPDRL